MDKKNHFDQSNKTNVLNDNIVYSTLRKDIIELFLKPDIIVSIKNLWTEVYV